ncbi:MAG: hypothetical protein DRG78_03860 [Epsilonproteobacteria bacterium]|nr:MAG: hypothetical protein DRG78_03860 [Campylobacterota bacterium]
MKKNTYIIKRVHLGLKRDIKSDITMLKRIYGVFNYKELALKLDISESAVKGWIKRKSIPTKYLNIIENNRTNAINTFYNEISKENQKATMVNGSEKININNTIYEICIELNKLSDKQKEYFYYLIKAEALKESL